jgi:cell division septum initiation protein DivIVA
VNGLEPTETDAPSRRPHASRSPGTRLGDLSSRLADAFSPRPHGPVRPDDEVFAPEDETNPDSVLARFPVVKHGYDCDAVDQHIDDLEAALDEAHHELTTLRRSSSSRSQIAAEIERLGEQTSAILITAHDKAAETLTLAEAEAQTCIADSASYAAALREEAELEQRHVRDETSSLRRERARLLQEIEATAAALSSLATGATSK